MCTRHAARHASLIVGMEFTIENCVQGHHSSKEFCTPEVFWLYGICIKLKWYVRRNLEEQVSREAGERKHVYLFITLSMTANCYFVDARTEYFLYR